MSDELVAQLRQHFSEGEVVEIAAVVGLMDFTNPEKVISWGQ